MYVFMQKITVLIWQGNSKAPKNYKPFTLETECKWLIFGVFRRGNKPSVLPRDRKTSGATIERASLMRAERLKNKKNLVYNSSGLATALLEYRRFFK